MQLISLHPTDNVAVALCDLKASQKVTLSDSRVLTLLEDIDFGHKVAIRAIKEGDKVLKYGLSIGSATRDIAAGEHVHVQNMKSDYIWRPDR